MYDSDMAVYVNKIRQRERYPGHLKTIEGNIATMKRWAKEGR